MLLLALDELKQLLKSVDLGMDIDGLRLSDDSVAWQRVLMLEEIQRLKQICR